MPLLDALAMREDTPVAVLARAEDTAADTLERTLERALAADEAALDAEAARDEAALDAEAARDEAEDRMLEAAYWALEIWEDAALAAAEASALAADETLTNVRD